MLNRNINSSSFPRIATIRKGTPKKQGKGDYMTMGDDLGEKLRFEPEIKDHYRRELLCDLFIKKFGSLTPTEIRCELMGHTPEEVLYSFYTQYKSSRQLIECDGETITREFNERSQRFLAVDKPCKRPANDDRFTSCTDCKSTSKLHVCIPELSDYVELEDGTGYRFFGVIDLVSTSVSDAHTLSDRLYGLANMAAQFGLTLQGMPIRIYRVKEKRAGADRKPKIKVKGEWVDNPNFMKPMNQEKWYLEIELDAQRWAKKLYRKNIVDTPFAIAGSEQNLLPQPRVAIAPAKNTQSPVSVQSKTPSQKFIDVVDSLIAKMTDVDMFIKAEDWIVVQDIYKEDFETQAIVNKKMDTVYKQLTAKNLTEPIAVASQPV